jgi:hypothetical protein
MSKTRSIPYWTMSAFPSTGTNDDLLLNTLIISKESKRGHYTEQFVFWSLVAETPSDPKNLFPWKPYVLISRIQ